MKRYITSLLTLLLFFALFTSVTPANASDNANVNTNLQTATAHSAVISFEPNIQSQEKPYKKEIINAKGYLCAIGGGAQSKELRKQYLDLAAYTPTNETPAGQILANDTQRRATPATEIKVLIIPFAGKDYPKVKQVQEKAFYNAGAHSCTTILSHENIDSEENLQLAREAHLIYFSGGSQGKLAKHMRGTKLLQLVKERYREGAVIAGTSAGASVMSRVMVAGRSKQGGEDLTKVIRENTVYTAEGFGLVENIIIHQHFLYRHRHNRLYSVLLDYMDLRGVGIDESTAIVIKPDNTFEVIGESTVTIMEPIAGATTRDPAFIVRILSAGDTYKL